MFTYVKDLCNDFDYAIRSSDGYDTKGRHYSELADIDTMVSYWLVMEIMGNEDAASRSRYCYIDNNGIIKFGPVWDFDISSEGRRTWLKSSTWAVTGTITGDVDGQDFYREFIDDPYFQIKAQEKYWHMRDYLQSLIDEDGIIDNYADKIYESAAINDMLWTDEEGFMFKSFTSRDDELNDVKIFKEYLRKRLTWLDKKFDTQKSTTEALYMSKSTNPYKTSSDASIIVNNASKDITSHGADYVLDNFDDVRINVNLNFVDGSIYVNGKFVKEIGLMDLMSGNINIPTEFLDEDEGKKNIIEVRSSEKKNYCTLRLNKNINNYHEDIITSQCEEGQHDLVHIDKKEITDNHYGNIDCYYCNKCHHYFKDSEGKELLKKSEVIITPYSIIKVETKDSKPLFIGLACTGTGLLAISIVMGNRISKFKRKEK